MDTDVQECKCCGFETDCIGGVCLECSLSEPKAGFITDKERIANLRSTADELEKRQINPVKPDNPEMENKRLRTAIGYHPDECPGCVDIYHQKGQYNVIFKCNECGDQRKLTLDPDDGYAFPVGLTSPANDCEIKR